MLKNIQGLKSLPHDSRYPIVSASTTTDIKRTREGFQQNPTQSLPHWHLLMAGFTILLGVVFLLLSPTYHCSTIVPPPGFHPGVRPGQIKNLVTFGDSYTDVTAFDSHGITSWPVYTASYSKAFLFPFARAGAVCSQDITPIPFPDVNVVDTQLPAYFNSSLSSKLDMSKTLFTIWIGTNDLGQLGLLIGHNTAGMTMIDTTACAVNWIKALYDKGARNFLFQKVWLSLC
jgi:hypothetical protein